MKTWFAFGILFFISSHAFTQGEWNNWLFGSNCKLDFSTGSPVPIPSGANYLFNSMSGCSVSVSDSAGNLLFYSAGNQVFNKNHILMPEGDSIMGCVGGSYPVFAVRSVGDPNQYYLFTATCLASPAVNSGIYYSVIDMTLDNGNGDIIPTLKNKHLANPPSQYPIQCVSGTRHANNRDVWVVGKLLNSTLFYAWLVDPDGLNTTPVISNSSVPFTHQGASMFFMKFSQDGSKMVDANVLYCELLDFNTQTGMFTPRYLYRPQPLQTPQFTPRGAEFSPNGHFLYFSSINSFSPGVPAIISQFDATCSDSVSFAQSEIYLATHSNGYGQMHLGKDGKIYMASADGTTPAGISVIHNPGIQGTDCNFIADELVFSPAQAQVGSGLPQFIQTYWVDCQATGECPFVPVQFSYSSWPSADSLHWDFGDPASGNANFSNDPLPFHTYLTPGTYSVELFLRYQDNRTDTAWVTVTILESPLPDIGPDTLICSGDSITFQAGFCTGCSYSWDNLTTGQFHIGDGPIYRTGEPGLYKVTVTGTNGCQGWDTVQLSMYPPVILSVTPPSLEICSGDTVHLSLSCNLPGCDYSWDAIGSSPLVTGFSNGSGQTIDQIIMNTDTIDHTVSYSITPMFSTCVSVNQDYTIPVHPISGVEFDPTSLILCSGQSAVIHLSSLIPGTTFSWTATGSAGFITGYSDGSGPLINQVLFNTGTETGYVIYQVVSFSSSGCVGIPVDYQVTLLPTVIATISPDSLTICSGETTNIQLFCNLPLCTFSWIAHASSPQVTGFASGNGNSIQQTLINTSNVQQTVTYTISPVATGCGGVVAEYMVTIDPLLPVSISISASLNPVCEGLPITYLATPIHGGVLPAYQWQVNANNEGMNNVVFTYTPVNGDVVSCLLTSSELCTSNNPATSNAMMMIVLEAPDVSFTACFDTLTTTHAKPFKLKGGIPLGGTYSGSGVDPISGYFSPVTAGPGTHEITYNYINSAGCKDSATLFVFNFQFSIFNCGDSLTDIRDNKKYPTVQIGSQCWLAANLNYGVQIPGSQNQRDNCIPEKYLQPPPGPQPGEGSVYQWDELMAYTDSEEAQGLCPPGWHVPSEDDWNQLFAFYQGNAFTGSPLLFTGYSGFNALLFGSGFFNRGWCFENFATFFWSSTSHGPNKAWAHGMNEENYSVSYYPSYRANAFSVRCVQD